MWLSPPTSRALAFFAGQPVDKLLVHHPPFTPQGDPELLIPVVDSGRHQVSTSNAKLGPRITPAPVAEARSGKSQHPAGPTLGNPIRHLHLPHQNTLHRRPQSFFESTSCNIFLSRLRSATNCFSFLFSSSKVRSRRNSATPSPANRFFHR